MGDARTYLWPVHVSGHLIQTASLAGSLQMFLFRFGSGHYYEAMQLASSCNTDHDLSTDEAQLFQRCGWLLLVLEAFEVQADFSASNVTWKEYG